MTEGLEICTAVVLSTAHISKETADGLDGDEVPVPVWSGEYGWFVWVPSIEEALEALPEDLAQVLRWAKSHGFRFVRFDCDGPEVEGLPVFEWE